ncbi:MAG: uroporphyrinogen-III synthase [Gammaproteobacteria bacterium]|jgi:uroporphyrinogen-III synthase
MKEQAQDTIQPLAGLSVLVTRPAHQADPFCAMIEAAGGRAVRFPVVEIAELEDARPLLAQIERLDEFDIAVFISPNAVAKAMNLIHAQRTLPPSLKLAAIGRKSALALEQHGRGPDIQPERRFDSEALLALPEMQDVRGKRIIIFRGGGGREVLGDTLKARGAEVEYAEAYRRHRPEADTGKILYHWSRGEIDIITVTSAEGLRNLFDMVGKLGQMWLRKTPLLLGSERQVETARQLGYKLPPVVAEDPSDEAMLKALEKWAAERRTADD